MSVFKHFTRSTLAISVTGDSLYVDLFLRSQNDFDLPNISVYHGDDQLTGEFRSAISTTTCSALDSVKMRELLNQIENAKYTQGEIKRRIAKAINSGSSIESMIERLHEEFEELEITFSK